MSENYAIGFSQAIDLKAVKLEKRAVPMPILKDNDVLVQVEAVSVNPVDVKMAAGVQDESKFHILGFDAAGKILEKGKAVQNFELGDSVYYSGQQFRAGANQLYQAVDARLIAKAPVSLSAVEAAVLPLTGITAIEVLTEALQLKLEENAESGKSIFIINGAGGVGSILIQLSKYLGMRVIASASRPETQKWVKSLGADIILNHQEDLEKQFKAQKLDKLENIAILHSTDAYWDFTVHHVAPFGRISSIVETESPIDMGPLKNIGAQFSWEFMFAKGNYGVRMAEQGAALKKLAALIDEGKIKTDLTQTFKGFSVENLEKASQLVADGRMIGKVGLEF